MQFYLPNLTLDLQEVRNMNTDSYSLSEFERKILKYAKSWLLGTELFTFQTSGSTGKPKNFDLTREQLAYSAETTLAYLFPDKAPKTLLLCLDPTFVGGRQIIHRALLADADLVAVEPSSTPLKHITEPIDLASMVPLQIQKTASENISAFHKSSKILIGGADLSEGTEKELRKQATGCQFYHTYGMTETASHVAIRPIGSQWFESLGDVQMRTDQDGRLSVKGTVTRQRWIRTNDVVKLQRNAFIWRGRSDWVINSGGIKIHPQEVEQKISRLIPSCQFLISSIPDSTFGEAVVLVTEKPMLEQISKADILSKYELPKKELIIKEWPMIGEKINRKAIGQFVREQTF